MSLKLPVKESLGVLLGILGLEWLFFGRADIFPALALAFGAGFVIFCLSRRKRRSGVK